MMTSYVCQQSKKVGDMEPEQDTKFEINNDLTDKKHENNCVKGKLKTEYSVEDVNENRKSSSISPSKNSLLTNDESFKNLRKFPSAEKEELPLNSEDSMYSDTRRTRKESLDANLSQLLSRSEVIERCQNLTLERKQLMLKNILLQKKLHDYYKKKKAEGMYVEGKSVLDGLEDSQAELLYRKNMSAFEDILDKSTNEKAKMDLKSAELFQSWNQSQNNAAEEVDSLLKAEEMYGNGHIKCSSGKILQEKDISFLVNRHKEVITELTVAVLKYIRVRDALSEKEAALKSLEDLGEGLSLINYELLNMEKLDMQNRTEERNAALDQFHGKIETAIVALSHFKEKIISCSEMVERSLQQLDESNFLLHMNQDKRAIANKQNIELRREIKVLQQEAELLMNHTLLKDFDDTALQIEDTKHEVNELKEKLKQQQSHKDKSLTQKAKYVNCSASHSYYSSLRNTSNYMSKENGSKKQSQKQVGAHNSKICKGRPSIENIVQS